MSYLVIARKWRPQTFDEVIGQDPVKRTLKNALSTGRIAHAYLFSGVRGVGKTTMARLLAKCLNCASGPTAEPCGECPQCQEIARGNAMDVLEIDAASNRGIDEVRELRENVRYSPSAGKYKIFIIDEVHMLTSEAFNALLKTLEEPPPHVVFILATTEFHKIPVTILSRCQHFDFRRVSVKLLAERLRMITDREEIKISDASLGTIARAAEGSVRDAESVLDQVISFSGTKVGDEDVMAMVGVVDRDLLFDTAEIIREQDSSGAFAIVDRLTDHGFDVRHFCRELLRHFRNLLVARVSRKPEEVISLPEGELQRIVEQAGHFSEEDLIRIFHLIVETENKLKWTDQPRYLLEVALLKAVQMKRLRSLEEVIEELDGGSNPGGATGKSGKPARKVATKPPRIAESTDDDSPSRAQSRSSGGKGRGTNRPAPSSGKTKATDSQSSESAPVAATPVIDDADAPFHDRLLARLGGVKKPLAAILKQANRLEMDGNTMRIGFPEDQQAFMALVSGRENMEIIKKVCDDMVGEIPEILVAYHTPAHKDDELVSVDEQARREKKELSTQVKKDPVVRALLETFQGEILSIEPPREKNS